MQAVSMRSGSFEKRWSPGLATTPSAPPMRRMAPPAVFTQNPSLGQGFRRPGGSAFVNLLQDAALIGASWIILRRGDDEPEWVTVGWIVGIYGGIKLILDAAWQS